MPFYNLEKRDAASGQTYDEMLLLVIAQQLSGFGVANGLSQNQIRINLTRDNFNLFYRIYKDYLWAYIRCYREYFVVDRDPLRPE